MSSEQQERAIRGAAGAPLTNEQKRDVCMLAAKVWTAIGKPGFADQAADLPRAFRLSESEALELWRQNQQRQACGGRHLTAARHDQFPQIMAQFRALESRALAARGKMAAAGASVHGNRAMAPAPQVVGFYRPADRTVVSIDRGRPGRLPDQSTSHSIRPPASTARMWLVKFL
jgi:hypothetical protein